MIWALVILGLATSFVISGLEAAILGVSRVRLRHQAKRNDPVAVRLEPLCAERDRVMTSLLLANNSINLVLFAFITKALADTLGEWGYVAALAVSLPIYVIGLEIIPKSLFKRFPYRSLRLFFPLLVAVCALLRPVFALGIFLIPAKWRHRPDQSEAEGREEFITHTNIIEREGGVTSDENALIRSVLDFHHVTARDVMIPLSRVTAVPLEMPIDAVLALARETGLDQFPVISPEGEIVGLVNAFEVLQDKNPRGSVIRYLRRLVRTRPTEKADTIIKRLRRSGIQLAAVCEAGGRTLGIVSVQDLVARMLQRG